MIEDLEILARIAVDDDQENLQGYPKDEVIKQIYARVYSKVEEEVIINVSKSIEKRIYKDMHSKRIKEYSELAYSGVLLALAVGLLVNQLTELISVVKDNFSLLCSTIVVSIALFALCSAIFAIGFSKKLKELL